MASGKSRTLITELERYEIANKNVIAIQPELNVRDTGVASRNGLSRSAISLGKLSMYSDVFNLQTVDVIGVDEAFMFSDVADTRDTVVHWLSQKKIVVAAALDITAMGNMPETIVGLLELAPDVKYERAVCTTCDEMDARYTLIYETESGNPIRTGLPAVVPDDGTYEYRPVCRCCFFGWNDEPHTT
jgi:thymidine kinase